MTVDELMLALHRDYLVSMAHLPEELTKPPLSYARFIDAMCLLITGSSRDEQGVLDRYLIYEEICKRQGCRLDLVHFVASCIMGNSTLQLDTRHRIAELMGIKNYLSMN